MKKKIGFAIIIFICISLGVGLIITHNHSITLSDLDSFFLRTMKKGDILLEKTDPVYRMKKKLEIGTIEIERVWIKNDYGYALVRYINDTQKTFKRGITIRCCALDYKDRKISSNKRSFYVHEYGLIYPGFEDRVEVPVKLHSMKMKSMTCEYYGD